MSTLYRINNYLFLGVVTIAFLLFARLLLIPLVIAGLLALALSPLVSYLERYLPGWFAISLLLFLCIVCIGFLGIVLYWQVDELQLTDTHIQNGWHLLPGFLNRYVANLDLKKMVVTQEFATFIFRFLRSYLRATLTSVFMFMYSAVFIFFYMFYFLLFKDAITQLITRYISVENINSILSKTKRMLVSYISGLLLIMLILFLVLAFSFWAIGVKFALLFATIAALFYIIPYLGNIIGAVPVLLYTLLAQGAPYKALAVLIVFVVIQAIENNLLKPFVLGHQIEINPLLLMVIVVIGGMLWGVAGIILFVPLAGIAKIIYENTKPLHGRLT